MNQGLNLLQGRFKTERQAIHSTHPINFSNKNESAEKEG
jgi:hypothetical protein